MTEKEFTNIYNASVIGIEMVDEVLKTVMIVPDDREYLRKMIMHIIHNERLDAALEARAQTLYN